MRNSSPAKGLPLVRISTALVLVLSELMLFGWFAPGGAAQDPAKPGVQQGKGEPGRSKPTDRKPKEEEEESTKPPRKPLRVGDEDMEENQPASGAKPGAVRPADLEREAKRAKHPAVQELFSRLAKPHDVVVMAGARAWNVEPIPEYLGAKPKLPKALSLQPFNDAWKPGHAFSITSKDIVSVQAYEELALNKVDEFLKSGLDRDRESKQYLSRLEMLQDAEKALGAVLLFHDSAVERGLRKGNDWDDVRTRLLAKLRDVQLSRLKALADLENWDDAFELASRLADAYPDNKDVQVEIVRLLARSVREALKKQEYGLSQRRLLVLQSQFPNSQALEPIRDELKQAAKRFMNEAIQLERLKETTTAIRRLEQAREIYPQLPGLHDLSLRLGKKNSVLYVGVHDLPEYLSPATAYLDSEKQAVELLFESLVQATYSPKVGQRYQPCLASDLPKMVPLGREFALTPGACWSDGRPVAATDVRSSMRLQSGYLPEWAELLQAERARIEEDNFHISLTLRQGYLDPLSLMSFKVLPQHLGLTRADDPSFAKMPTSSGPYKFEARDADSARFVANPYYEMRPGKNGLPRIREIRFVRSENPVNDFQEDRLQLLLDLPTSRYKELEGAKGVTPKTLPNRRIYFLAVNHHHPVLGNNEALRRAIAHAINREQILNDCFRAGLTPAPHRPLNGPYPPGSWAYNPSPRLKADPFKPDLVKTLAVKAKDGRAALGRLTLKYPNGDPAVAKACKLIQEQVRAAAAGIELDLQPLEPRELRRDVEERHDYQLAYYSWDYPDETFWLWPLLDPQATKRGGGNFLGYRNDEELGSLLQRAMLRRDPFEVKKLAYRIHEVFYDKMPFIPLWQLDTHLAIHNSLAMVDAQDRPVDVDPLLIFTNVETWTLNKR